MRPRGHARSVPTLGHKDGGTVMVKLSYAIIALAAAVFLAWSGGALAG